MADVVHVPQRGHSCGPNTRSGVWWDERGPLYDAPGTVRQCECGRTWVAERRTPGLAVPTWRREGRFERWRRERRERSQSAPDGWVAGVRWAAAEADAQAAGREPVYILDITDHLRACADDPERGSVVPRSEAPVKAACDE